MDTLSAQPPTEIQPSAAVPFWRGGFALLGLCSGAAIGGMCAWPVAESLSLDLVSAFGGLCGGAGGGACAAFVAHRTTGYKPPWILSGRFAAILAASVGAVAGVVAALIGAGSDLAWRPGGTVPEAWLALVGAGVGAACGAIGGLVGGAMGGAAAGSDCL